MCGFAGFCDAEIDPSEFPSLLATMADAIAHRGPDARGIWQSDAVGLAHVRLSIVGLGDGQQPMASADGALTIVFNGEIFNYVELREALKAKGYRFRTGSDTEVILALYEAYGDACLAHMNGDFAFALWDARRHRMLLARDRMGVRPLFYARRGRGLVFGSEVKALLALPGMTATMDPFALDQIFTFWAPIAPRTAFKDIFELEPGQCMALENGHLDVRPYWTLDYPDLGDTPVETNPETAREEVLALLTDAVRLRMRADVPVGAYLSGGLDSSLICALAAPMAQGGLNTFSVTFDSAEHDESAFQHDVAGALSTHHRSIGCGPDDIARVFAEVIRFAERPILRTAPAPLYSLAGLVRDNSMKVVLTGEGADEIFGGYDIFKEAKLRRFCASQPGSRRRPLLFRKLYPYLPGLQTQTADYLSAFFGTSQDRLDDPLFSHRPRMRNTAGAKLFFSDALRSTLAGYDAAEDLVSRLPARFGQWHPLHQAQYLETRFLLPGYILSSQGDRMAMAHGVEGRFPFLDHRLVELATRLPPALKLKGLTEKHILREVARDLLPELVGKRPKQPYRAPDSASFAGPAGQAVTAGLLSEKAVTDAGLFDPRATTKLAQKAAARPLTGFRDNAAFIGMLSSQIWQQRFAAQTARARRHA
ncbi:asparagine synthase (glutamine-hydrolyzing) [Rhizobium sp. FY34]|uniref:asparagine synthase (glutamine-hydrolyzing) n=1 Tax=Rhizobium sp. FY34 TaxID=2562309 RepID=UPI0010C15741|nr:asparagine synthase (glutamine-hydrolyzing) [Rhizobium sp. FY34]